MKIIKNDYIDLLLSELQNSRITMQESISNSTLQLYQTVDRIRDSIYNKVSRDLSPVKQYKDNMIKRLKESMNKGAKDLKQTLNSEIDDIFGNEKKGRHSDITGVSSLLSFTYSDYLRLFLMVGLYTSEDAIILRTADVIQTNIGFQTNKDDYRLSNSAVYVNLNATLQVKPTLLALPLFSNVSNNPINNEKWYTMELNLVKGY